MDREGRRLEDSKEPNIGFTRVTPSVRGMSEGQKLLAHRGNKPLGLYIKELGHLWWTYLTRDGDWLVDRDLKVERNVKIGRHRSEPQQPSFLAYNSVTDADIAKDTYVTVDFDTEVFDIGGNFAADTFTAPKSGKYFLSTCIRLEQLDSAADHYQLKIETSNRIYVNILDPGQFAGDVNYWSMNLAVVVDMEEGDTAIVQIKQTAGAVQTDIFGNATSVQTYFSGYLLG